jgi:hypothetical protein
VCITISVSKTSWQTEIFLAATIHQGRHFFLGEKTHPPTAISEYQRTLRPPEGHLAAPFHATTFSIL